MLTDKEITCVWGGLRVSPYKKKNIDPLIPLLQHEFSNWSLNKIHSYMNLVMEKTDDKSGVLVAKNESSYNVGIAIYTFQQIGAHLFTYDEENEGKNNKVYNVLVIENIIASSPILEKPVFMALVQGAVKVAEYFECDYLELPNIDSEKSFEFVQKNYSPYVEKADTFRTYIKVPNDNSESKLSSKSP